MAREESSCTFQLLIKEVILIKINVYSVQVSVDLQIDVLAAGSV